MVTPPDASNRFVDMSDFTFLRLTSVNSPEQGDIVGFGCGRRRGRHHIHLHQRTDLARYRFHLLCLIGHDRHVILRAVVVVLPQVSAPLLLLELHRHGRK